MTEKKFVLITGYKCNNNCRFCYDSNKRNIPDKKTKELLIELFRARKLGCNYVDFIGGEVTDRKSVV